MDRQQLMEIIRTTPPFKQFADLAATLECATIRRDGANVWLSFADDEDARLFVQAYEELMATKRK